MEQARRRPMRHSLLLRSCGMAAIAALGFVASAVSAQSAATDRIAFVRGGPSQTFQLWTMNGDGSAAAGLTTGAGDKFEPTWSPDGRKLAFELADTYSGSQIWVV